MQIHWNAGINNIIHLHYAKWFKIDVMVTISLTADDRKILPVTKKNNNNNTNSCVSFTYIICLQGAVYIIKWVIIFL